jgi:hypothetical protein
MAQLPSVIRATRLRFPRVHFRIGEPNCMEVYGGNAAHSNLDGVVDG